MTGLEDYIYKEIVPLYASFDAAHREDHVLTVIDQAARLMEMMPGWIVSHPEEAEGWNTHIKKEILLTAAACHDLGLVNGRENHHIDSGRIIRSDSRLKEWFKDEEIEIIAQAAEDHRASGKSAPRSIYGMLVAEADRVIDAETIIRRTIQFGLKNYPGLDCRGHIDRAIQHLREKYGRGGYLKLWIPWSDNAVRLAELQDTIADDKAIIQAVTSCCRSLGIN